MSIIEEISSNAIKDLCISQDPDEALGRKKANAFLDAIESNTSIEKVDLDNDFIGCLRQDQRSKLMGALGKLPNVKEIHLGDACLLVTDIAEILVNAKSLVSISLTKIVLQGDQEALDTCEVAICQHPNLKQFDLKDSMTAMQDLSMDKLLVAGQKACNRSIVGGTGVINGASATTA